MPILDSSFLDTDPEGAELLRSVLDTGRRARRRTITDLLKVRDLRTEASRLIEIAEADDEPIHPGVLAAAAT